MPPYQWTLTGLGRHDKDIEGEAIKPIKGIRDMSLRSEKEEGHSPIDPLIEILHQEEHALNADKWATLPGIVQGRKRKKASTSSTITITMSRSTFHPPPCHETT